MLQDNVCYPFVVYTFLNTSCTYFLMKLKLSNRYQCMISLCCVALPPFRKTCNFWDQAHIARIQMENYNNTLEKFNANPISPMLECSRRWRCRVPRLFVALFYFACGSLFSTQRNKEQKMLVSVFPVYYVYTYFEIKFKLLRLRLFFLDGVHYFRHMRACSC